jgi:hypothetical protein
VEVVSFPNITESTNRALHDVLSPFLSTGNSRTINGTEIHFFNCQLVYNVRQINEKLLNDGTLDVNKPLIGIIGKRVIRSENKKCHNGTRPVFENRSRYQRSVVVMVPYSLSVLTPPGLDANDRQQGSGRMAHQIYDQLFASIIANHSAFRDRNIYYPKMSEVPTDDSTPCYAVASGYLDFEARVSYYHE